jgi:hypothetical protein
VKDLIPLKSLERDELEISLLESANDDQPSPAALRKAAVALGVPAALIGVTAATSSATVGSAASAAVAGSSSTAAATSATAAASTVAAGSTIATSAGIVGITKAVVVGLGASAVIGGAVVTTEVVRSSPPAPQQPAIVASAASSSRPLAPIVSALPTSVASAPPVIDVDALPRVAPAPSRAAPVAPSAAPVATEPISPPATSSVTEEVAELDRARALVAAKKPGAALGVLDEFARRWPRAILAPEAAVLRVEAELARGNRAGAERLARSLIAAQPNSAYARKVANLVGIDKKE